ncbi:MAG TPA: type IX secretion system sortase PorU [Lentimicrobium sp.]|nr:type IX secretion system sortase PorU [Lentimicrobium sp.]
MKTTYKLFFTLIFVLPLLPVAQIHGQQVDVREIKHIAAPLWEQPVKLVMGNDVPIFAPSFKNAQYPDLPESFLPQYIANIQLEKGTNHVEVMLDNIKYIPLTIEESNIMKDISVPSSPETKVNLMFDRGIPVANVSVKPYGIDPVTGLPAKLDYFEITLKSLVNKTQDTIQPSHRYPAHSRMSYGDWFRMWITQPGIYRITYEQLQAMGMNMSNIHPDNITMYGRGGRPMNEIAGNTPYEDMTEISIRVISANPDVFKPGDYVLFYAEGPITWKYNTVTGNIDHFTHPWTDAIAYFITVSPYKAKRIPIVDPITVSANGNSNAYTAIALYEKEEINLIKSGRKWFSDKLDNYTRSITLPEFNFPDLIMSDSVNMRFGIAGRATQQMTFNFNVNNKLVNTSTIAKLINQNGNDYAYDLIGTESFSVNSNKLKVVLQFLPPNNSALGWLDFVALNVRSTIRFHGPQFSFRDPNTVGEGKVINFNIESSQDNLKLWDVTNQAYVHEIPMNRIDNGYTFRAHTPWLREFVAFDGTSYLTPDFEGKVPNQDLHAIGNYDMIIITPPFLNEQAKRVAELHKIKGDVTTKVVSLPQIYNEFSSGNTDITAIRDFMKMLYDRGRDYGYPKYLMLFGGSSYDTKDRILNNSNPIPTYQSYNSVKPTASYLSDDFYGLLDDNEGGGESITGLLDIGIGRIPVRTIEQAEEVVDKIEAYLMNDSLIHGDWRNNLLIIADDEDNNTHFTQAEKLCDRIAEHYPIFNVDKIYFDAYKQNNTPGGGRFPDAQRALNSHIEKGVLLTNYIGHGGELGWADERVLEIADIEAWNNFNQMGLFFTATCEFSRFDDPQHTSAGELVFLNPSGGAMAMITTTRLAYSSTNEALNYSFIDTVISKNGGIARLGDIIKYTKNEHQPSANLRHLTLFGDPSIPMPLPKYNVITTSIIDPATLQAVDTLSANSKVVINGEVHDLGGQLIDNFNGEVSVTVYDKISTYRTLGQDLGSVKANFQVQNNKVYQGKAKVLNGIFSITFPVPRDIDYNYGHGKISYYATDGHRDANGYFEDFIIGGSKPNNETDETGPEISLWINDTSFIEGGLTGENPKLLVRLYDESGINTLSSGVGHDLTATLDNNSYNSVLLNDFYIADQDTYKSGSAAYKFFGLEDGEHIITVKAWDVYNNSSEKSISFKVKHDIRLDIDDVTAYPNPSKGKVWFRFKHNLFDAILNIEIEIYNSTGELVRVLTPGKITANGYIVDEVVWDGLSSDGTLLRNGLYIARVKVLDRNNNSSAHSVKILMTK